MAQFWVGQKSSFSKQITEHDVATFAELSGDKNPLHLDEEYAKRTRFGRRIAHGMLTTSLISTVIGTQLPGVGSIYMSQSIKWVKPVYLDDTVTATAEITAIRADKGIITLKTACTNQKDEIVAEGEAVALHPDAKTQ